MDVPDLFDFSNTSSLVRALEDVHGDLNLNELIIPPFIPSSDYLGFRLPIISDDYRHVGMHVRRVTDPLEKKGYSHSIFTGLFEAVLNAYQHGNKKDPAKKIILHILDDDSNLELCVSDEGGLIDKSFYNYVSTLRYLDCNIPSFYDFSKKEKQSPNLGQGLKLMMSCFNEVYFHKSELGGLLTRLIRSKDYSEH